MPAGVGVAEINAYARESITASSSLARNLGANESLPGIDVSEIAPARPQPPLTLTKRLFVADRPLSGIIDHDGQYRITAPDWRPVTSV